jgi:8-oxo-dGTP pyrophosphatase MutT (NUDIX family)
MKKISAGVVVTDGNVILGCKSYQWDLPKGEIEPGEKPIEAAIREAREETGLVLKKGQLVELGFFEYTKYKDLWLFLHTPEILPDTDQMQCTTYFENKNGKKVLEVTDFRYIPFSVIEGFFYRSICNVLRKIERGSIFSNHFPKEKK